MQRVDRQAERKSAGTRSVRRIRPGRPSSAGVTAPDRTRQERVGTSAAAFLLATCLLLGTGFVAIRSALAGDPAPISAAAGLAEAASAASAWTADAELVYVENDEPLDEVGQAARWGYLFRSPSLGRSRGYSVEEGKVVEAADLEVRFEAPPLGTWIDSGRALQVAEEKEGAKFRVGSGGRLAHMVLVRSAADPETPERTCWLVIYQAPGVPALFVLVDAKSGSVDRTWRG